MIRPVNLSFSDTNILGAARGDESGNISNTVMSLHYQQRGPQGLSPSLSRFKYCASNLVVGHRGPHSKTTDWALHNLDDGLCQSR